MINIIMQTLPRDDDYVMDEAEGEGYEEGEEEE